MAEGERDRINIDRGWRFAFGDPDDPRRDFGYGTGAFFFAKAGFGNGPAAVKFDDRAWRLLDLPHDWAVELPHDQRGSANHASRAIGIGFPQHNIGWYRRSLAIPTSDRGRRITIEFDGVYRDAVVWFNGHYIGNEHSGYSSVSYDLTDYVDYGGPNVIVVRVNAAVEEGWYYEGAGIYRHVWLNKTDAVHVAHWGTAVTTELGPDGAVVTAKATVDNDMSAARAVTIDQQVLDADGRIIASATQPGSLPARSSTDFTNSLTIAKPALWSIETPVLHHMVTTIRDQTGILDRYETSFGIRTVRFDPDTGFWLNGKNIKLKGANNHQDHAGIGVALPDAMQTYRLKRLQAFGANAYRTSHNPPTPELLDAADRLGMLVIDEHRMMGTTPELRDQLHRLVQRDRNHPSVILWSVGNEEWALEGNELGARITREMTQDVKRLDPSRRVMVAISGGARQGSSTTADVLGFNYRSQHDTDGYHKAFPTTPTLMTEEGSTVATRGIYVTDPQAVHIAAYDVPQRPSGSSSIQQGWQAVAERPWMAGMFVWTGFDYGGETTPFGWPAVGSQFGMLDSTGAFKDSAWYLKSQWSDAPVIHILPHWNWPGRLGQAIPVWIYANADEVELLLNGKSLGRKPMPRYGHLEWQVGYTPGTLVARGFSRGREVASDTVATTGPAYRIEANVDRPQMGTDGVDMAVVTLRVLDASGRPVPTANDMVSLRVAGTAHILGVGNGDPGSHDDVRPVPLIVPGPTSDWKIADIDLRQALAKRDIEQPVRQWRDPFAYYPPGTEPAHLDHFILRGTMVLASSTSGAERTLFLPDLTEAQEVYVDGHDMTAGLRRDDRGRWLALRDMPLGEGAHSIAILVRANGIAALAKLRDIGLNGTNVASVQTRVPAPQWKVRLFNGQAQVLVQATDRADISFFTATSPGLVPARTTIMSAKQ